MSSQLPIPYDAKHIDNVSESLETKITTITSELNPGLDIEMKNKINQQIIDSLSDPSATKNENDHKLALIYI